MKSSNEEEKLTNGNPSNSRKKKKKKKTTWPEKLIHFATALHCTALTALMKAIINGQWKNNEGRKRSETNLSNDDNESENGRGNEKEGKGIIEKAK